jgi:hypothetical protein
VLQTTNALNFKFDSGFISIFTGWKSTKVVNFYVFNMSISSYHGSLKIIYPLRSSSECNYTSGSCVLTDKSTLFLTYKKEHQCPFVYFKRVTGYANSDKFISDDVQISLTTTKDTLESCGQSLVKTVQGFAIDPEGKETTSKRKMRKIDRVPQPHPKKSEKLLIHCVSKMFILKNQKEK